MFSILWTIIIGFVAGVIAKFITPGDREPQGFILTTVLGIIGAFDLYRTGRRLVSGWSEGKPTVAGLSLSQKPQIRA
jgi:uncharacterized membrane protein YeaQ/YmgE (transglycosylase-associated protein family)